ncbi:MAG: bifunctional phosphopantothenoylcysteine decarboxylase/phosphopantothenate--cysteine ligase CoaBC [Methylococcaceae bacterium]|nr:bifunctional phosphopantothenoylcysteine decarboxylase/phosphopantothenate--cysteine ligase CoaBC [Methylococcaceae bacterium]
MTINKRILLGVGGGIAAYKAAELVRLFRQNGAEVRVVMTHAACQFVTPLCFQALSGHPVHTELLDSNQEQSMGHIHLARWADCLVIAPATANRMAKMAQGIADDLLSTLYLAAECPVWLAPAMNQAMWRHPATQRNLKTLQEDGVKIIGPASGEQACGELGPGRLSEPSEICAAVLASKPVQTEPALKILITAGPTREALDPVRFISNRSSGKMGYALASAAIAAGAEVTLVSGPVNIPAPAVKRLIQVESAQQMHDAVMANIANQAIVIGCAAVADYRPAQFSSQKIKKTEQNFDSSLQLTRNPDIIASVAALDHRPFTVGFAAETQDVEDYALSKLRSKGLDMIAANQVGLTAGGFDSEQNALKVFWPEGEHDLGMTDKQTLAKQLLALIIEKYHEKNST